MSCGSTNKNQTSSVENPPLETQNESINPNEAIAEIEIISITKGEGISTAMVVVKTIEKISFGFKQLNPNDEVEMYVANYLNLDTPQTIIALLEYQDSKGAIYYTISKKY